MGLVWYDSLGTYGTGTAFLPSVSTSYEDCYFATAIDGSGKNVLRFPPSVGSSTCFFTQALGPGTYDNLAIPIVYPTFGVGLDFFMHELPRITSWEIYPFLIEGDTIYPKCFHLKVGCTGYLTLRCYGQNSEYLEYISSTPIIVARRWHHIEVEFKNTLYGGPGYVKVYVDNVLVFNESLLHFYIDPNFPLIPVWVHPTKFKVINDPSPSSQSSFFDIKNVYTWDDTGSINNTLYGNVSIADLKTTSDDSLNWTPSTGSNGYSILDNNPPTTTQYITAADTSVPAYIGNLGDLPADVSTIKSVKVSSYAKALSAADANIQLGIKSGGSTGLGTNTVVGTTAAFYTKEFLTDPATSAAWTKSGVDGAKVQIDRSN